MKPPCHPAEIDSELTESRLNELARHMLDVFSLAIEQTKHPLDDAYTQGSRCWAWLRNSLLQEGESRFPWLRIVHHGNDIQFSIGNSVFRFFCDDPERPRKHYATALTDAESLTTNLLLFDEESLSQTTGLWRFFIRKAMNDEDEHSLYCINYQLGSKVINAKWQFNASVNTFVSTTADIPEAAKLPEHELGPRTNVAEAGEDDGTVEDNNGSV
ncbi:hypothetical protein QEN58_14280 [Halomonas alkaliantarctica]|uniref:Uncharacterized protein n=1 Tax=Halomonas alkaliantarctica TaxID=232346 RepID=A0ABY8LJ64_9GAMM|nr:hypothetical protein [Halomonas alkaliantarctica]WGI24492.1 hypothetical protein QEN58_14280 [Halomonas alkaliantarctica]